jgi:transcriptional regulator with XRE-family HTH domain
VENGRELSIESVRELARDRSEQRSQRYVADQAGLSISTLNNFLRGAMPQPRIRHKLAEWYVREVGTGGEAFSDGAYVSAVQVLVTPLPTEGRTDATEDVIAVLERLHDKHGLSRPVWVERLRSGEEVPRLV